MEPYGQGRGAARVRDEITLKIERRLDIACQPSIPGSVSDIPGMNVVSIKAINIAR
jgi:hypothetical protein